jgi:VWFA-related protein
MNARSRWSLRFLLLCLILPEANHTLAGQTGSGASDSDAGTMTIRKSVRRVVVDVTVTDANRKPVRGLGRQDFSISEDGKPQHVLSFEIHDFNAITHGMAKLPALPPNTFVNAPTAPERGPLYVILYDLVNMEMEDQMTARQQLLNFIRDKPAGTRFAIFTLSDGLHLTQGFTEDKDQLYAAADPAAPHPRIPKVFLYSRNYGKGDVVLMISVFTDIAQYLDGLPGRKDLIWIAGSFPLSFFPSENESREFIADSRAVVDALARGQVAVYPVDVRGVVVQNPRAPAGDNGGGGVSSDFRTGGSVAGGSPTGQGATPAPAGGGGASPVPTAGAGGYSLLYGDYSTEDEIARVTGGRAVYSDNNIKAALSEVTESGANYYTLSYSPTNSNYDGKLRNIQVEVARRGYQLSYRRSYVAAEPDSPLLPAKASMAESPDPESRKPGDLLYANMQYGAPMAHQVIFRAHVQALGTPAMATAEQMQDLSKEPAYYRKTRRNKPAKPLAPVLLQTYAIDYTVAVPKARPHAPPLRLPSFEIAAAAFNSEGVILNSVVDNAVHDSTESAAAGESRPPAAPDSSPAASPDTSSEQFYRARQLLLVPVHATSLRLAVRDMKANRIGALDVHLPLAPEPASEPANTK